MEISIMDLFIARHIGSDKVKHYPRTWLLMSFFMEEFKKYFEKNPDEITSPPNFLIKISFDDYCQITRTKDSKQLLPTIEKAIDELASMVLLDVIDETWSKIFGWFRSVEIDGTGMKIKFVFSSEVLDAFLQAFDIAKIIRSDK